jgi:hypothetical protein
VVDIALVLIGRGGASAIAGPGAADIAGVKPTSSRT